MLNKIFYLLLLPLLMGCGTTTGTGGITDLVKAGVAVNSIKPSIEQPSAEDLALSCPELNKRTTNLYARYEEIEKAEKIKRRKNAVMGGILNAGVSLAGAAGLANAGTASGLRNVGVATNVARAGVNSAALKGSNVNDLKTINDATLIAERVNKLERVKLTKGC